MKINVTTPFRLYILTYFTFYGSYDDEYYDTANIRGHIKTQLSY